MFYDVPFNLTTQISSLKLLSKKTVIFFQNLLTVGNNENLLEKVRLEMHAAINTTVVTLQIVTLQAKSFL